MQNAACMRGGTPLTVVLTVMLVAICAPHAAEDFQFGQFTRLGVAQVYPMAALGVLFAAQVVGAFLAGRRSRSGFALLIAAALVWVVGAVIVHGPDIIASGAYRNGVASKALEVGIIFLGAATALAGAIEWRNQKKIGGVNSADNF